MVGLSYGGIVGGLRRPLVDCRYLGKYYQNLSPRLGMFCYRIIVGNLEGLSIKPIRKNWTDF